MDSIISLVLVLLLADNLFGLVILLKRKQPEQTNNEQIFKDEVRQLGKELKIPEDFIRRHPFPGPGLGIRILGEIKERDIDMLREADKIFIDLLKKQNLYDKIWQAFCVLLPVKTVGVMGDNRTYEKICVLRAVTSVDGMTAEPFILIHSFFKSVLMKLLIKLMA